MNSGKLAPSDPRYEVIEPVLSAIMLTSMELGVNAFWSGGDGGNQGGRDGDCCSAIVCLCLGGFFLLCALWLFALMHGRVESCSYVHFGCLV